MKISYNWLNDLIEIELSPEQLAAALTRVGLAVEGVDRVGDDYVLDIDLTSNRPDCLSHLGVAREVSAITGKEVVLERRRVDANREIDAPFPAVLAGEIVRIDEPALCRRFTGRVIGNVKVGPSPDWLVRRLEALGERTINNIADITNYVMLELGQPMHAFDIDQLAGGRLIVRRAKIGESIRTLDGADRLLDDSVLAICDAEKPVAVAGIIGGIDSAITDSTVNVLLEVAYFDRDSIRASSRRLGVSTEASYRFERGVDVENLKRASDRAAQLMSELASGESRRFVDLYPAPVAAAEAATPSISAAVERLTGLKISEEESERILHSFGITRESVYRYSIPTWRHDLALEEDLVEEIARHYGYEKIRAELPAAFAAGEYQPFEAEKRRVRRALTDVGYDEAITYSFIDEKWEPAIAAVPAVAGAAGEQKFVTLKNPIVEGSVLMRPSLIPGLLAALRLNLNQQRRNIRLFEIGKVFGAKSDGGQLPTERETLAIAITGGDVFENRDTPPRELDFYDAKGAVEIVLQSLGIGGLSFAPARPSHLRRGQAASVLVADTHIGYVGRLAEELSAEHKFRQAVFVAEIDLNSAFSGPISAVAYSPLPRYPAVKRDVSFLVSRDVSFADVLKTIEETKIDICDGVRFVDLYEGKGMEENERSLTVSVEYRSSERTLVDDEVAAAHDALLAYLETTLGVRRRF